MTSSQSGAIMTVQTRKIRNCRRLPGIESEKAAVGKGELNSLLKRFVIKLIAIVPKEARAIPLTKMRILSPGKRRYSPFGASSHSFLKRTSADRRGSS